MSLISQRIMYIQLLYMPIPQEVLTQWLHPQNTLHGCIHITSISNIVHPCTSLKYGSTYAVVHPPVDLIGVDQVFDTPLLVKYPWIDGSDINWLIIGQLAK